jgi:hypothetical protein
MDQEQVLVLALVVGFVLGWVVAWVQESAYRRQREKVLRSVLELEKVKVRNLEFRLGWVQEKVRLLENRPVVAQQEWTRAKGSAKE